MALAKTRSEAWPYGFEWRPEDDHVAPLAPEGVRPPPARRQPSGPEDIARVLHADDDQVDRRILQVLLTHPRIALTQVHDGEAAVDLLAMRPYDLVLLDIDMAGMSGEETLAWIRRSVTPWSDVPVVGLVSEAGRRRVGRLISAGLTDWTPKPLERLSLVTKLVGLLPSLHDAGL